MPGYYHPPHGAVVDAVARALAEDLQPLGDMTSGMLDPSITATAQMNARKPCLLYTSPSPRDATLSRMPSSA